MKDIRERIVHLLRSGYCTPQIGRIAKHLKAPAATIHYNIKRLEEDGAIKTYKAVLDHKKVDEGFCTYVLVSLSPEEYVNPEAIANALAKDSRIESVDICTGDWEMVLKVRCKDQDGYYDLVKTVLSRKGIIKVKSLMSLKQVKSESVS